MRKFHISKNGVPAPCHAKKGNCPLGGDSGGENHFDTAEEAQVFIDKKNESEHGLLPGSEDGNSTEVASLESLMELLKVRKGDSINSGQLSGEQSEFQSGQLRREEIGAGAKKAIELNKQLEEKGFITDLREVSDVLTVKREIDSEQSGLTEEEELIEISNRLRDKESMVGFITIAEIWRQNKENGN